MANETQDEIKPDGKDQEFLQERYVEMQLIEKQVHQLRQRLQIVEGEIQEVRSNSVALDEMSKVKPGEELMIPLANGIFMRGTVKETEKLLVGVGASIVVEKDIPSTKNILDQRLQTLEKYHKEVLQGIMTLDERGRGLEKEMRTVIEKYQ